MDHFASSIASLSHLQELVIYSVPPLLVIPIMDFLSDKNAKVQLHKLALHCCGDDGDFPALASFLQRSTNTHLNHLEISQLELNPNEITSLCNALKTCTSISSLSLEIPLEGALNTKDTRVARGALVDYFTNNSRIQKLSLRDVWCTNYDLVSVLNSMPSLQDLTLVVRMDDQLRGCLLFKTLIANNTFLKKLNIAVLNLHDSFLPQITQGLAKNTTLESLTLEFGDKTAREFDDAFCRCSFLSLRSSLADRASSSVLQHLKLQFCSFPCVSFDSFESIVNLVGDPNCQLKSLAVETDQLDDPSQALQLLRSIQDQPSLSQLELKFRHEWEDDDLEEYDGEVFDRELANIISSIKYLQSLNVSATLQMDGEDGDGAYWYRTPNDLQLRIAQSVTDHKSLEYVMYGEVDDDNVDLEFAHQLNALCAQNVASKAARAFESLSIQAFPLLFARVKKACQKLELPDADQATVLNSFVKVVSVKFSGLTLLSPTTTMDWEHAPL